MKVRITFSIFFILAFLLTASVFTSSVQSSEVLEANYAYSVAFPPHSNLDTIDVIENAKDAGYWVRIGSMDAPEVVDGKTIMPNYSFYRGNEVLDCPNASDSCLDYPVLYAYPKEMAFKLADYEENYTIEVLSFPPPLPYATQGIVLIPESDMDLEQAETVVSSYLSDLGISQQVSGFEFVKGMKQQPLRPFDSGPSLNYEPTLADQLRELRPNTGNPALDRFISYEGIEIAIVVLVLSACFVAYKMIRHKNKKGV